MVATGLPYFIILFHQIAKSLFITYLSNENESLLAPAEVTFPQCNYYLDLASVFNQNHQ